MYNFLTDLVLIKMGLYWPHFSLVLLIPAFVLICECLLYLMAFVSAEFEHNSGLSLLSESVLVFQLNTYIHGLQFE